MSDWEGVGKFASLASRLKWLRHNQGINSQAKAAAFLHIPFGTYQRWESGASSPGVEILKKIATLYHCSFSWLITGEGGPSAKQEDAETREISARHRASAADESASIAKDMALAAKILSSKTHYATALHLNIRSFAAGIQDLNRAEKMASVESRLRDLEQKLEAIQKENTTLRTKLAELESRSNPGETHDGGTNLDSEKKAM